MRRTAVHQAMRVMASLQSFQLQELQPLLETHALVREAQQRLGAAVKQLARKQQPLWGPLLELLQSTVVLRVTPERSDPVRRGYCSPHVDVQLLPLALSLGLSVLRVSHIKHDMHISLVREKQKDDKQSTLYTGTSIETTRVRHATHRDDHGPFRRCTDHVVQPLIDLLRTHGVLIGTPQQNSQLLCEFVRVIMSAASNRPLNVRDWPKIT